MKLTDTQAILLAAAANRADYLVPIAERLKGGAAEKVARSLIDHGLATEVTATRNDPFWREEDDGNVIALRVTRAGLEAVGIEDDNVTDPAASTPGDTGRGLIDEAGGVTILPTVRGASKRDTLISLLSQEDGASVAELMAATGWLPHTVRAALTGLRKRGMDILRFAGAGGTRYRVGAAKVPDCMSDADGHSAAGMTAG